MQDCIHPKQEVKDLWHIWDISDLLKTRGRECRSKWAGPSVPSLKRPLPPLFLLRTVDVLLQWEEKPTIGRECRSKWVGPSVPPPSVLFLLSVPPLERRGCSRGGIKDNQDSMVLLQVSSYSSLFLLSEGGRGCSRGGTEDEQDLCSSSKYPLSPLFLPLCSSSPFLFSSKERGCSRQGVEDEQDPRGVKITESLLNAWVDYLESLSLRFFSSAHSSLPLNVYVLKPCQRQIFALHLHSVTIPIFHHQRWTRTFKTLAKEVTYRQYSYHFSTGLSFVMASLLFLGVTCI